MLNAVIIDDKTANIDLLHAFLTSYCPHVTLAGAAVNVEDAYGLISKLKPSLVFLDIELGDGTGFDLLRKFKQINFEVIFTTAYNQYAVQAFRENALDYLLKPIDIELLQQAVAKAEKQIGLKITNEKIQSILQLPVDRPGGKISVPVQNGYLFISPDEIYFCEASGSYTHIYMKNGKKLLVSMRLKECEEILPARNFFRVHHSYLVNTKYITEYIKGRGGFIVMENGAKIEVAVSRKDLFLKHITGAE